jgi:hypothetical protein
VVCEKDSTFILSCVIYSTLNNTFSLNNSKTRLWLENDLQLNHCPPKTEKYRVKWDHDLVFHHCWTFHTKRDEIEILKNMHVKIPFAVIDKGYSDSLKNSYSYLKVGLGHSL